MITNITGQMARICDLGKMKLFTYIFVVWAMFVVISCASSHHTTVMSNGSTISEYKYVVFGKEDDKGDAELADILMMVQNELSKKFVVVSYSEAIDLTERGEKVISPRISVKSEKGDGGHTYISISFYDFITNQGVAVVKSSGIGWTISHDQKLAFNAIKKELDKIFK